MPGKSPSVAFSAVSVRGGLFTTGWPRAHKPAVTASKMGKSVLRIGCTLIFIGDQFGHLPGISLIPRVWRKEGVLSLSSSTLPQKYPFHQIGGWRSALMEEPTKIWSRKCLPREAGTPHPAD